MQTAQIVFGQVAIMFILVLLGVLLAKTKILTKKLAGELSNLLLKIILPTLIISSFIRPLNPSEQSGFFITLGLSFVFHIIAIGGAYLLIKKGTVERVTVQRLAAVYSNCGFMAFPILSAVFGDVGLLYGSAFAVVFNVMLWTNGVKFLEPGQKLSFKRAIINPGVLAAILGLSIYFLQIPILGIFKQTVSMISALNTPLSMLITGAFLSDLCITKMLKDGSLYKTALLRNLVFPLAMLGLMWVFRIGKISDIWKDAGVAAVISASCSTAASTPLMVARIGRDGTYGAQLVAFSTVLSVATLPFMAFLAQYLL